MGLLNDKIAFIAGGSGNVGEGIVRAFLEEGDFHVIWGKLKVHKNFAIKSSTK